MSDLIQSLVVECSIKDLGLLNYFIGIEVILYKSYIILYQQSTFLIFWRRRRWRVPNQFKPHFSHLLICQNAWKNHYLIVLNIKKLLELFNIWLNSTKHGFFAVNKVYELVKVPTDDHCQVVKQVLRYSRILYVLFISKPSSNLSRAFSKLGWLSGQSKTIRGFRTILVQTWFYG